jgi:putative serine protease PepD
MTDDTPSPAAQPTDPAPWWSTPDPGADDTARLLAQPPSDPPPPADPPPPGRSGPGLSRVAGLGVLVLAVALGSGLAGAEIALHRDAGTTTTVASGTVVKGGTSPTETLAKVAAAVQPTVVSIKVAASGGSDEGSGVIMTSDGAILTNNHVISAAADGGSITVTFSNGNTARATIVGRDASTDLAVIKASGVSNLKPATFGTSDSVHVGDTVLAIGSPLGLEGSVSAGIISALHRPVDVGNGDQQPQSPFGDPFGQQQGQGGTSTVLNDAIQTDAPINPGNSGGPLVDAQGRVIGINSAIASLSSGIGRSGNIGVGFAIPIDEAKGVANQLLKGQTVTHAVLGVSASDVTGGGARIEAVTASSGAAKAGLRAGDIITKVDSTIVSDATELTAAIRAHAAGDKVQLTYTRNGSSHTTTATLGSGS